MKEEDLLPPSTTYYFCVLRKSLTSTFSLSPLIPVPSWDAKGFFESNCANDDTKKNPTYVLGTVGTREGLTVRHVIVGIVVVY